MMEAQGRRGPVLELVVCRVHVLQGQPGRGGSSSGHQALFVWLVETASIKAAGVQLSK